MKIKQTIRTLLAGAVLAVSLLVPAQSAMAAQVKSDTNKGCEVNTAILSCTNIKDGAKGAQATGLWSILLTTVNILTAGVGVLALGGVVYGGVLYASAGGNPEQVKKARMILFNVSIGVVAFAGMWAFLNFIIPGGAFTLL